MPKENERHATTLTALYAAPFIWENILGQKYCEGGVQGEAADVFAFGVTIQKDILQLMLKQLGKHYDVSMEEFLFKTKYQVIEDSFEDKALLELEQECKKKGYRLIHPVSSKKLFLFLDREHILNATMKAIDSLQGKVNEGELQKMQDLAKLACDLQPTEPAGLNFKGVVERLQKIFSPEGPSNEIFKKRKLNNTL